MKTWRSLAILAILPLVTAACGDGGDGGGGAGEGQTPRIEVTEGGATQSNGSTIPISFGSTSVGDEATVATLLVNNLGEAPLRIHEISVDSEPEGLFRLVPQSGELPTAEAPVVVEPLGSPDGTTTYVLEVRAERPADVAPTATLTMLTNSRINDAEVFTLNLEAQSGGPRIGVSPSTVNFGNVPIGDVENQTINILNTGTGDLVVEGFVLQGHPAFAFVLGGSDWSVGGDGPEDGPQIATEGVTFDEPIVIAPGTRSNVSVRFSPTDVNAAEGQVILQSNDGTQPNKLVPLNGNKSGPCISVMPRKVDFGGKLIGNTATVDVEILSCGEEPLTIHEIALTEGSSSDYGLNLGSLPGVEDGVGAIVEDQDAPVTLEVNETATFQVTYVPNEINPLDDEGQPIPDEGVVHIASDALASELDVDVRGFGVETECPTSVIVVQEGEEVIPQTKLHIIGSQSFAPSGDIAEYEWSVEQPPGSQSVFIPSASAPDPTFEVNVAGTYTFKLTVWDESGEPSCVPAEFTVFVNPDEAIHVELLWDTPADPDQTDEGPEAGADLDLHFLHPFAVGEDVDGDGEPDGWFDIPYDCFWFNSHPNWGSQDPNVDDDPGLDRDDTDGAGPENINLNLPEDGLTYEVGVHYWDDHGFGPSYATIRVYIHATLVFEIKGVELFHRDLWEAATIAWPSGEVDLIQGEGGEYRIFSDVDSGLNIGR